jgi:hypothetical protein
MRTREEVKAEIAEHLKTVQQIKARGVTLDDTDKLIQILGRSFELRQEVLALEAAEKPLADDARSPQQIVEAEFAIILGGNISDPFYVKHDPALGFGVLGPYVWGLYSGVLHIFGEGDDQQFAVYVTRSDGVKLHGTAVFPDRAAAEAYINSGLDPALVGGKGRATPNLLDIEPVEEDCGGSLDD